MKKLKTPLVFISLTLLLAVRYFASRPVYKTGDRVRISTRVLSEPIDYSSTQYLRLEGLKVYLPKTADIHYGDFVIVEGIVGESNKLQGVALKEAKRTNSFLYRFRQKTIEFYRRSLPEPHASLVAGMTLGSKNMPQGFWEKLKNTGTAHVVVASGTNVTLVAGFLMAVLVGIVNRRKAVVLAIIGVWMYVAVSGFDAPLVRAAIMGSIAFGAQALGRLYYASRALIGSAFLMLMINPMWISDIGFILSFVATLSMMLFSTKIDRLIYFMPRIFREGLATSLSAQIGVAPILFITFGQFNILSPVINALILWTVPFITIGGFAAGILRIKLILYGIYPPLAYFIWLTNIFS